MSSRLVTFHCPDHWHSVAWPALGSPVVGWNGL